MPLAGQENEKVHEQSLPKVRQQDYPIRRSAGSSKGGRSMSRSTISTFQLFQMFPDEETARVYLESRLWPKGVTCPTCAGQDRITPRKAGFHRCNKCQLDFTIRTGTIFERSHIPLHKWLYAMYLIVTARKGISSMQIAKEIGVQQKSAWFMLHRLREACGTASTTTPARSTFTVTWTSSPSA